MVQKIESAKTEMERLRDEMAGANPGYSTESILDWLTFQPASAKFIAASVTFKPAKGESAAGALIRNREAQTVLRADRRETATGIELWGWWKRQNILYRLCGCLRRPRFRPIRRGRFIRIKDAKLRRSVVAMVTEIVGD